MSDEQTDQTEERTPEEIRAEIDETREELGETVEELAAKTDVKGRAQDKASETKEKVQAKAAETKERVQERVESLSGDAREATPDSAAQGAQQAAAAVRENPDYAVYAGLFTAGLVAGWILRGR